MASQWLLTILTVLLQLGCLCSSAAKLPFRSARSPADIIKDYEVHVPVILRPSEDSQQQGDAHPGQLHVQVSQYAISLELNSGLIHPRFTSHYFDENGKKMTEMGHVNCFYHGKVEGHDDWQVTMSTCHGLQGSFGRLGSDELYHIEPLDKANPELEQTHALYLDSQYSQGNGTCGTSGHSTPSHVDVSELYDGHWTNSHKVQRRQVNGFYIVEWALINDNAQYLLYDRNLSAVVMRSLEVANIVDSLYRPLSIRVVVVNVMTWTRANPFQYPANNDSEAILNSLTDYVFQLTTERDSIMLMTGVDLLGSTIGLAFVGTMCSARSSVGLTQDRRASLGKVASTAAHELGHIFNMQHDDSRACTCTDPTGDCIMSAVLRAGSPNTIWSSCSRSDLNTGFARRVSLSRCLNNEPSRTVGDPSCGNGIRENNEVCDCGSVAECTDPCCNATTCVLRQGAQCSEGPCCSDSCQFLPLGDTCRAVAQECDIEEYCSGSSSDCPRDVYMQDGTPCNSSQKYCFTGACQSLDAQCQRFFRTENGDLECYSQLNVRGSIQGNCGARDNQYVACEPENTQCGQLMCNGGGIFQRSQVPGLSPLVRTTGISSDSGRHTCASFTISPTADTISPGLVPDGTRCGNESVCVSQVCVALSSLSYIQACPVGNNGETCSGNGVCNNLNQCSCSVGFSSESCATSSSTSSSNTGAIVGAVLGVVLFLLGVTAAVVIVAVVLFKSKKKSVPLTARSRPAPAAKAGKAITASQENLLEDYSVQKTTSHTTHSKYQPPPMKGSALPTGQVHSDNTKPPSRPAPPISRPAPAPTAPSRVAPAVNRHVPNPASGNSYFPKASSRENPSQSAHLKPKAPPPSRAIPPAPAKAVAPTTRSGIPSAPLRSGLPPPSPHKLVAASGNSRSPAASSRSAAASSSSSYLKGRSPSPELQRNAQGRPYDSKQAKLPKQWPSSSTGGNGSPSTSKRPILPAKKPFIPPR